MKNTWKPMVTGILCIVSAASGALAVLGLIIATFVTSGLIIDGTENIPKFIPTLLISLAIPFAISSALSLYGGMNALKRQKWGWVLAGSIASVFSSIPLVGGLPVGIFAIVLTALSKEEFK